MKFHLPKKLLVAVLAAMTFHTAQAGYYTIGGVIGVDADGNPETKDITSVDIPVVDTSIFTVPIAKDGSGTLTLTEEVSRDLDLYIREGQFEIKSHYTSIHVVVDSGPSVHHTKGHPGENATGKQDGMLHLSVAGKDAVMIIDGAGGTAKNTTSDSHWTWNVPSQYTASFVSESVEYGAHVAIGGVNGNGKLIVQNNAYFTNAGGWSTHIGYSAELDETDYEKLGCHVQHATTATIDGKYENIEDRYIGNYTQGTIDSSQYFGKGEVYVRNNSYIHFGGGSLNPGYANGGGIYMGEAILSIEDHSKGEAGDSYFGTHSGAQSEIKIVDNSELILTRNLFTGYEKNGITVADARIVIDVEDYSTFSVANDVKLSTNASNTTTTTLSLTNNSKAEFGSLTVGSESGNSTAEINIDKTSSVTAYNPDKPMTITINHGSVNNAGTVEAESVTINNGGKLSMMGKSAKLSAEEVTVNAGGSLQASGGEAIAVDTASVTVKEDGTIVLKDGSTLTVRGALTLAQGSRISLYGDSYSAGDVVLTTTDGLDFDGATVALDEGQVSYTIRDGQVILTAVFSQNYAEALTVSNWGIATASRAFVNSVRGQRTNTGCIGNGRGTAWVAVLGATNDIGIGDVSLKGAVVGADMKVGEKNSIGIAVGYVDGDAEPAGLSKVEQEGTYMAIYGEHELTRLGSADFMNLDWVAAYGQTKSEWKGVDWEQQSLQLNSRLSWNKNVTDRLCVSVFGGLEYFTTESDTVEKAKTGSMQNLRGELGVGARYVAWATPGRRPVLDEKGGILAEGHPGCEKLVLHAEMRYINDMVRSNPVIEQDGLRGNCENPGRSGMGIEAGASFRINERWSSSVNYGFNAMGDSHEHRVNVGASYTF